MRTSGGSGLNRERVTGGFVIVAGWLLMLAMFLSDDVTTSGSVTAPDANRAQLVAILGGITLVAGLVLGLRSSSGWEEIRDTLGGAVGGAITGAIIGFITAMPFRVWLPRGAFWFVILALYGTAVAFVVWFVREGSGRPRVGMALNELAADPAGVLAAATGLGRGNAITLTLGHKAYEYTRETGYQAYEHVEGYNTFQIPPVGRPLAGIARPDVRCPVCEKYFRVWIPSERTRRIALIAVGIAIAACLLGALGIFVASDFELEQFGEGARFGGLVGLGASAFALLILGVWISDVRAWVWASSHKVM